MCVIKLLPCLAPNWSHYFKTGFGSRATAISSSLFSIRHWWWRLYRSFECYRHAIREENCPGVFSHFITIRLVNSLLTSCYRLTGEGQPAHIVRHFFFLGLKRIPYWSAYLSIPYPRVGAIQRCLCTSGEKLLSAGTRKLQVLLFDFPVSLQTPPPLSLLLLMVPKALVTAGGGAMEGGKTPVPPIQHSDSHLICPYVLTTLYVR